MSELSEALERQLRKLMPPKVVVPVKTKTVKGAQDATGRSIIEVKRIDLGYQEGNSDKVYHVQILNANGGFEVHFQYGRRGKTLIEGKKTSGQVAWSEAASIYSDLVHEKKAKGYKEI